jgi:hypothetical protein
MIVTSSANLGTIMTLLYAIMTSVIRVNRVSLNHLMTLLWHYYDTIMRSIITSIMTRDHYDTIITLLSQHYDTIITLSWPYYDCIITQLWLYYDNIITLLWQYYTYYDWIYTPHFGLLPEHGGIIMMWALSLELDFNQQVGAQLPWKAAGVSCPVLLYTL